MKVRRGKRGQVAIFLVLILAGLTLLFALNVDVFTSSRAKIRLQNAADASALALARWQGITLNLIGELNLAHLAAVCAANTNAAKGTVELQRQIARMGPLIGLNEANILAKANNVPRSEKMTRAFNLIASFTDAEYRRMLEVISHDGMYAGLDNVKVPQLGPLVNPDFYKAVKNRDFRWLCIRFGGGRHRLPDVGSVVPSLEELFGDYALFGNVGLSLQPGNGYEDSLHSLVNFAHDCGIPDAVVSSADLRKNAEMFSLYSWGEYDPSEWRDLPDYLSFAQFPWFRPIRPCYSTMGGSATFRVENTVALSSIAAQTNFIAAQAAAKIFGSYNGKSVLETSPRLILPVFSFARLVPFSWGANDRYGWADDKHVRGFPRSGTDPSEHKKRLDTYNSDAFRTAAEVWYSTHGHHDADGCCPPTSGTERGGGTPYGI